VRQVGSLAMIETYRNVYKMKILNANIIISNKLDPSSAKLKNNMRFP
jgi:hypothetical protein